MKKGKDWRTAIIIIITVVDIIYQLTPADFIPDAVPVLGQIDDSILLYQVPFSKSYKP